MGQPGDEHAVKRPWDVNEYPPESTHHGKIGRMTRPIDTNQLLSSPWHNECMNIVTVETGMEAKSAKEE